MTYNRGGTVLGEKTAEHRNSITISLAAKVNLGNYQNIELFESATTRFDDMANAERKHNQLETQVKARMTRRLIKHQAEPTLFIPTEPQEENKGSPGTPSKEEREPPEHEYGSESNTGTTPSGFDKFDRKINPYKIAKELVDSEGYNTEDYKELCNLIRNRKGDKGLRLTRQKVKDLIPELSETVLSKWLHAKGYIRKEDTKYTERS